MHYKFKVSNTCWPLLTLLFKLNDIAFGGGPLYIHTETPTIVGASSESVLITQ